MYNKIEIKERENMNEMQTMDYILSIIVLGYGLYLTIQNIRMFIANQKARRDYLAQTKNQYQMVNQWNVL